MEFSVALRIGSVSLFADRVDFLEDAPVNFLIAVALGWSAARARRYGTGLHSSGAGPGNRMGRLQQMHDIGPAVFDTAITHRRGRPGHQFELCIHAG